MKLKSVLRFYISLLIFQLVFCQLFRLLFILISKSQFDLILTIKSMYYGIQFDLGISFIVVFLIAFLLFILKLIDKLILIIFKVKSSFSNYKLLFSIVYIFMLIQSLSAIGDIILYKYWDSIFSVRAFSYLHNLGEMFKNISILNLCFVFLYIVFINFVFHFLVKYYLKTKIENYQNNFSFKLHFILLIFLVPSSFLAIRGGFREIPRNQSDAFFSTSRTYNLASINSIWNFFNVLVEHNKFLEKNPYIKMDKSKLEMIMAELFQNGDNYTINLFEKTEKPNIVLITLEGVSAELLKISNGKESQMPFLESMIDSSYYFTRAYSIGFRTEQGLAALLSGSLSTPFNNITDNINTLPQIPSIVSTMKHRGYKTSFIFGGNVEFANMRAYLTEMKFDKIIDVLNFESEKRLQKLGVPDEFLFRKVEGEFCKLKSPFFIQVMTQSTHEPYDIPNSNPLENEKKLYIKSSKYLDDQLKLFFENIRKSKQFSNTIFIICSDHSHRLPNDKDIAETERYHIPFLIYSPLLKKEYINYKDTNLFAQQNFPATLTYLLHWKEKNYLNYSLNHFSNSPKFIFSSFVNGYVFQRDTQVFSYDYTWRPFDTTKADLVKAHSYPQAIMQTLVDEIRSQTVTKSR